MERIIERMYLNIINAIHDKFTANTLNDEKMNLFF